jgi:hypothetical protein
MELRLCEDRLFRSFYRGEGTADCEEPGAEYTLGLCVLLRARRNRVLAVHNVAQPWLEDTEAFIRKGMNWDMVTRLVFVLDPEKMGCGDRIPFPQAEAFSHLFQAVEQYCGIPPGQPLPLRVAVVLPVPQGLQLPGPRPASADGWEEEFLGDEVRELLRTRDPALAALLAQCLKPAQVAYFGGVLPADLDLDRSEWVRDALRWLL